MICGGGGGDEGEMREKEREVEGEGGTQEPRLVITQLALSSRSWTSAAVLGSVGSGLAA